MELFHGTATECHLPYGITQCYLPLDTSEHTPPLTPAMQAGTRFTYPGGMEGWVDLVDLIANQRPFDHESNAQPLQPPTEPRTDIFQYSTCNYSSM